MKTKTVVITGSSSGIGYALANKFQESNHHVYGLSRRTPKEDFLWTQIATDLTKEDEIRKAIKRVEEEEGQIDLLINCAGMGFAGALEDTSPSNMSYVFEVNVLAPMMLIQQALPLLKKSEDPRIVNIGSVASEITIPFQTLYSMSKSALMRLTEGLRMELKPFGVQVTTILPGDTKTEFTSNRRLLTEKTSPYYQRAKRSVDKMARDEANGMDVESVVKLVCKEVRRKRMHVYRTVGFKNKVFVFLSRLLPTRIREMIIYKLYAS